MARGSSQGVKVRHMSVNTEHKDRVFKFLFGNPEKKEWTLSLYNAVNGSSYDNPDDIEFNTIDEVLYLGMKNSKLDPSVSKLTSPLHRGEGDEKLRPLSRGRGPRSGEGVTLGRRSAFVGTPEYV